MITSLWGVLISFTNNLSSGIFPVVAFWAYASLAGQPLRVDVAFPALQLFTMLESSLREIPRLITVLLNANVAMSRIENFMDEPDKTDLKDDIVESQTVGTPINDNTRASAQRSDRFELQNATFAWSSSSAVVLRNINMICTVGITLVQGRVGAGKSALLQAMLGELDLRGGNISYDEGPIAYCSQTPWLQSSE